MGSCLDLHLGWLRYFTLVRLWCGRAGGRTVTWLPTFLGWVDYFIFLPMVLRCAKNKEYSWTSPQRPPWEQKKVAIILKVRGCNMKPLFSGSLRRTLVVVAVVYRGLNKSRSICFWQESMYELSAGQKNVAVVKRCTLVEVRLYYLAMILCVNDEYSSMTLIALRKKTVTFFFEL